MIYREYVNSVWDATAFENPEFKGVQKCSYCTLEQIILEQVKIDLDREKANEVRDTNI